MTETDHRNWPTRRTVLEGGVATGFLLTAGVSVWAHHSDATTAPATPSAPTMPVSLKINMQEFAVALDPRTTLLDTLRNHLGLTGSNPMEPHATLAVWSGEALMEEAVLDRRYGLFVNHDLAEYHVAVTGDVPDLEVVFLEEHDEKANPLGAKGLGELGVCGAGEPSPMPSITRPACASANSR